MGHIIGWLRSVFRRSHGEKRTSQSALVTRRSVPLPASAPTPAARPPALAVADGYVEAVGVRFAPVTRSDEFLAAVPSQPRIALRLPTLEYGTVMLELMNWFDESEYDEASPEYRAYRYSALVCAGCGWEFPGSYTLSLVGGLDARRVVGATSGFAGFGKTGRCPHCGSRESFLLYERIDPADIGEEDLNSLMGLWRDDALLWWSRTRRATAVCDSCNRTMRATEGYLVSASHLKCEECIADYFDGGVEKLRGNPYYYGATELRRARPFRTGGELTEGSAPDADAYGVEHVLVLWDGARPDAEELKELVESVVPGSTEQGMALDRSDTPALSRGLAYWHIHNDEVAGRVTPGAWRRTRLTLRDGGPNGGRRMVAMVAAAAPDATEPAPARHEWAREMVFRHVARVELELRPDLMTRPTWCQLLEPEVLDFVLDAKPSGDAAASGTPHSFRVRTFGALSVVVSLFDVAQADRLRYLMGGGWESHLDTVLDASEIRLGERDVAHWIFGKEPGDGATVAHLAYLPAEADCAALVPVDLLARTEKPEGQG